METPVYNTKEEEKKSGSSYWEQRAKQQERDARIIGFVDRYEILTPELVRVLLDMEHTASPQRIVQARLLRLAQYGYIRQRKEGNVTYYVTTELPANTKKKPQNSHRLMEARFWVTLEKALGLEAIKDRRTAKMLRIQGGTLIADGFFKLATRGYFLECDNGTHNLASIREKCEAYYRDREYFAQVYGVEGFQVLWLTKFPRRVQHILEHLQGVGTGGQWLVIHEEAFSHREPQSILDPIWRSPKDEHFHSIGE